MSRETEGHTSDHDPMLFRVRFRDKDGIFDVLSRASSAPYLTGTKLHVDFVSVCGGPPGTARYSGQRWHATEGY